MDNPRAGEVNHAVPEAPIRPGLGQPPAAPNPVGVNREWQRHPKSVQAEALPTPTFRHRADGDVRRSGHHRHGKEKQGQDPGIVETVQEETLKTDETILESAGRDAGLRIRHAKEPRAAIE